MRNPINKRIGRLLVKNMGKYLPIFLLMLMTIVVCSSFYIVQGSIEQLYFDNLRKSKVEDGQFTVLNKLSDDILKKLEKENVDIYENFYIEEKFDEDKTLRIFKNRENINIPTVSNGKLPESENEIAISNSMAKLNNFELGHEIVLNNKVFKIIGYFSVPDYIAVLKNRADIVMDNKAFSIGIVNEDGFKRLNNKKIKYNYSYHSKEDLDKVKANDKLKDLYKIASKNNFVTDYVTRFDNKCITYLIDDMGGDVPMITTLMVLILISYAFIFTVQAKALVEEESTVIGTLLASGYKKSEMLSHYMIIPILITILSAIIGNILSYTKFYSIYTELYYGTFNLPTFKPIFNIRAFVLTTFIPILIMISVNYFMLYFKLKNSPLKFLRNEIRRTKNKSSKINLNRFKFLTKFKLRVILDNKLNILSLFFGLLISNILLIFGLSFMPIFSNYANDIKNEMQYNYINIVKMPEKIFVNADKGVIYKLDVNLDKVVGIQFYGLEKNTKYNKFAEIDNLNKNEIIISEGFANRYNFNIEDELECSKPYSNKVYRLKVKGIIHEVKSVSIYMPMDKLNNLLENDSEYFNVYFSDEKIKINEENIITTIDKEMIDKFLYNFLDQFKVVKKVLLIVSVSFYTIFLAILSKLIIEKSRVNISYLKIFGYKNSEVSKIYINSIRNAVFIYLIFLMSIMDYFIRFLVKLSLKKLDVYIEPKIPFYIYPVVVLIGILIYIAVQFVYSKKISKINMVEGLKNING